MEEQCVVVRASGEFYLTHCSPEDGKEGTITDCLYDTIKDTTLHEKLAVNGCDGTGALTGINNGTVRQLEEKLNRPFQWAICILHCNKLHLRHVFTTIDCKTTCPSSFNGPIGWSLVGCVSEWGTAPFEEINNINISHHPNDVLTQLSYDQFHAS